MEDNLLVATDASPEDAAIDAEAQWKRWSKPKAAKLPPVPCCRPRRWPASAEAVLKERPQQRRAGLRLGLRLDGDFRRGFVL